MENEFSQQGTARAMKLLFLTNIPSPYRVDFFNELGKRCDLTVLYERKTAHDRDAKWLGHGAVAFQQHFLSGLAVGADAALCLSVLPFLRSKAYDVVIVGGYSTPTGMLAIQFLKRHHIPFLLNCDGGLVKEDTSFRYRLKKYFIGSASAYLTTGAEASGYLRHYGATGEIFLYPFTSIGEADRLQRVISAQEKQILKSKLGIQEEKMVLSVGQFIHRKGYDVLLKACVGLPKTIGIYIVGGEPTAEYLDQRAQLGLTQVHFVGFKQPEELQEYYCGADLFVLPTREDIWGLVINEAMAKGLPIVTTHRCVAGTELVKNGENGFIVPVDDPALLGERMGTILSDDELRHAMAEDSLAKIGAYTLENMAKRHIEILQKWRMHHE